MNDRLNKAGPVIFQKEFSKKNDPLFRKVKRMGDFITGWVVNPESIISYVFLYLKTIFNNYCQVM